MDSIRILRLNETALTDLSPLRRLAERVGDRPMVLELRGAMQGSYEDMEALAAFEQLSSVLLGNMPYTELVAVLGGKTVTQLEAASCGITEIAQLAPIGVTRYLILGNNPELVSLAGIEQYETLEYLDVSGCDQLRDFTPLLALNSLTELSVSPGEAYEEALRQLEGSGIEIYPQG